MKNHATNEDGRTNRARAASEEPDDFLKKKELSLRLKVTTRTIENWQRRGVVPFVKVGKVVLFYWADVVEALKTNFGVRRGTITK